MSTSTTLAYTPVDEIETIYKTARAAFASGKARSIAFRKEQLSQLAHLISDNRDAFNEAIRKDLGRSVFESNMLEISPTIKEITVNYNSVTKWAKDEYPPFSLVFSPMKPRTTKEPKGTVLVIAPFNYPVWLAIGPMAGAIAAGCAVVVKPSESSPAVSALMAELVPQYLDKELYHIVNGAIPETTKLLELKWDHIMYTGSDRVAKIVATAAAQHLTPISLELGGKSPAIIDPNCDLKEAARKLWWGKMTNAGQTCIAPDYVLVPKQTQDGLIAALKEVNAEFYPSSARSTSDFGRLATPGQFKRVNGLLERSEGTVVIGGSQESEEAEKYIPPTLVSDVKATDSLMSEEIFGPVLPLMPVADLDEALHHINAGENPLALYVFSQDAAFKRKVFENTLSGSAVANEVIVHIGIDGIPFGGVGNSGYGQWTGKFGFDTFTHQRCTVDAPSWLGMLMKNRLPPYTDQKATLIGAITKPPLPPRVGEYSFDHWKTLASGVVLTVGSIIAARKV